MKTIVYITRKKQFSTSAYCMHGYPNLLLLLAVKAIIIYFLSDLTEIDKR